MRFAESQQDIIATDLRSRASDPVSGRSAWHLALQKTEHKPAICELEKCNISLARFPPVFQIYLDCVYRFSTHSS